MQRPSRDQHAGHVLNLVHRSHINPGSHKRGCSLLVAYIRRGRCGEGLRKRNLTKVSLGATVDHIFPR